MKDSASCVGTPINPAPRSSGLMTMGSRPTSATLFCFKNKQNLKLKKKNWRKGKHIKGLEPLKCCHRLTPVSASTLEPRTGHFLGSQDAKDFPFSRTFLAAFPVCPGISSATTIFKNPIPGPVSVTMVTVTNSWGPPGAPSSWKGPRWSTWKDLGSPGCPGRKDVKDSEGY